MFDSPEENAEKVQLKEIVGVGTLEAEIVELRESYHIGDLFRGFSPGGALREEVIPLGKGMIFFEDGCKSVGVYPKDQNKREDWMDPKALYKCHHQTVNLWFVAGPSYKARNHI